MFAEGYRNGRAIGAVVMMLGLIFVLWFCDRYPPAQEEPDGNVHCLFTTRDIKAKQILMEDDLMSGKTPSTPEVSDCIRPRAKHLFINKPVREDIETGAALKKKHF